MVMRYLMTGERMQEWPYVPAIDESKWWQRLSIGTHEQPSLVLVRTDRQMLLVRRVKRKGGEMSRPMLPLEDRQFTREEVRVIAAEASRPAAGKPEQSQPDRG